VPYQTKFGDGRFTEVVVHPLAEDGAMERYQPPDPTRPELYQDAARMIAEYKSEYFIAGATVTTIFETGWALRGLDRLLMDFVERPEMAEAVLDIPFHYHLEAAKRPVEMGVDMIWTGDDVGSQTGMMISPRMWRKYLKPRMAEFFATLKRLNPELKIAYHSDGVIDPIVGDLVEIGMDILNPLQPNCVDPARLKREYGDRISFWGSIDEQYALPFGTPEDVTREVQERLETVGRDGGLIIGPTHNVQLDTPMENFWAMMKAIKEPRGWN
jgi:uroporphyrinogen decarboxylase